MASCRFVRPSLMRARSGVLRASLVLLIYGASSAATAYAQPPQVTGALARSTTSLDIFMPSFAHPMRAVPGAGATIVVDSKLQGTVDTLLDRSLTFRRQWQRLLQGQQLVIRIQLVHSSPVVGTHAVTKVTALPNGSLVADVSIPGGARVAEVLGHEVEHVLERLDGARVSALHALGDQSVRRTSGTFETERAILVGRLVSDEYYTGQ